MWDGPSSLADLRTHLMSSLQSAVVFYQYSKGKASPLSLLCCAQEVPAWDSRHLSSGINSSSLSLMGSLMIGGAEVEPWGEMH